MKIRTANATLINVPHHRLLLAIASHARQMNALPSSAINRRSPRVVLNLSMPNRGPPPGLKYSHTHMHKIKLAIAVKKIAVGCVHAIQPRSIIDYPFFFFQHVIDLSDLDADRPVAGRYPYRSA